MKKNKNRKSKPKSQPLGAPSAFSDADGYADFFAEDGLEEILLTDSDGGEVAIPFNNNAQDNVPFSEILGTSGEDWETPPTAEETRLYEQAQESVFKLEQENGMLKNALRELKLENRGLQSNLNGLKGAFKGSLRRRSFSDYEATSDRLPPHSLDLEQAVLGAYIKNPLWMADINQAYLDLMFYEDRHRVLHKNMMDLGAKLDVHTLQERLKESESLEAVGGAMYIYSLAEQSILTSPASVQNYVDNLELCYLKRNSILAATQIVAQIYDNKWMPRVGVEESINSMPEFIRQKAKELLACLPFRFRYHEDIGHAVGEVVGEFDELVARGGVPKISTGYAVIDRITHGIRKNRFVVLGARPKMAKTTVNLNLAYNLARQGHGSVIFTFETTRQEYIQRLIARHTGVNSESFYIWRKEDTETPRRVQEGAEVVKKMPIWFDSRRPDIDYIADRSKELKMIHPEIELIVVDGMQSFAGYVQYQGSKANIYYEILKKLKGLAGELDLTVLLNAQLDDRVERRRGKRPNSVADLRDCPGLSEVTDAAILMYRPEEYWPENPAFRNWVEFIPVALRVGDKAGKNGKIGVDLTSSLLYNLPEPIDKYEI